MSKYRIVKKSIGGGVSWWVVQEKRIVGDFWHTIDISANVGRAYEALRNHKMLENIEGEVVYEE